MKKLFTLTFLALATNFVFSQDSLRGIEKFRFGLKLTPSINWFNPQGNIISNNGVALRYGGGLILERRLAKLISIQSGLQVDVSGGKATYANGATPSTPNSNSVSYYYNTLNGQIVTYNSGSNSPTSNSLYQLDKRNYNITYVTLPITLKMKTKEIGYFTYYGQIGINNSFRWQAMATDNIQQITAGVLGSSSSRSKIDVTSDVSLYTAALNVGLGAEMTLSGNTALTFGLNYISGFTNVVKNNSEYLERTAVDANGVATPSQLQQTIHSNAIVLLVGVLF